MGNKKEFFKSLILTIVFVSLTFGASVLLNNTRKKVFVEDVTTTVYAKYNKPSSFVVVYEIDENTHFHLNVDATAFAMQDIGDKVTFDKLNCTKFDKSTQMKNDYDLFGLSGIFIIVFFICSLWNLVSLISHSVVILIRWKIRRRG